jgi:hypothetical protein
MPAMLDLHANCWLEYEGFVLETIGQLGRAWPRLALFFKKVFFLFSLFDCFFI